MGSGFRGREGHALFDAAARGGNADLVSGLLRRRALPDLKVVSASSGRSALYLAMFSVLNTRRGRAGADMSFRDPVDE